MKRPGKPEVSFRLMTIGFKVNCRLVITAKLRELLRNYERLRITLHWNVCWLDVLRICLLQTPYNLKTGSGYLVGINRAKDYHQLSLLVNHSENYERLLECLLA